MSIKITFTGDFCPIGMVKAYSKSLLNRDIYGSVLKHLIESDLSVTNLECPLTESSKKIKKYGPNLKARPESVELLVTGKFKLATLANNHILDYSSQGLMDTIDILHRKDIGYVGAGADLDKASQPYITSIKGMKIAIVNYTQSEYSIAGMDCSGANPINPLKNAQEIAEIKKNADTVIVVIHGGHEHESIPSPYFRELLRFYASCNVKAVIGHHTHVCSGYEIYNAVPIFYGLGNFIFPYKKDMPDSWYEGCLLQLELKDDNTSFNLIPFTQSRDDSSLSEMNDVRKSKFMQNIERLNNLITNDIEFRNLWESKFKASKLNFFAELMISNRWIRALVKRKLIPISYVISDKDVMKYYHIFFCESHKEQIQYVLNDEMQRLREH